MKMMKKIAAAAAAVCLMFNVANAQESKSPAKELVGKVNGIGVEIKYCAPSVRDREIFGELVPFDKVWRAGANDATTIMFSNDCIVEGKKVKAGTYAFFVTPKEDGKWDIMLNSEAKQWGAYKMDAKKNVLVTSVEAVDADNQEQLTYSVTEDGIQLHWADKLIDFTVTQ